MQKQYIRTYNDYIEEFNDLHEAYLLSLFDDRMRSSLKRPQFTDNDGTFIMFTIEEIMDRLKVGRNKAVNLLASLVKRGYVAKKRLFNATKLYLPKFVNETNKVSESNDESLNPKPTKVSKSNSNQSHLNKKLNQRFNTSDTGDRLEKRISNWKRSVIGSSKIPELAVDRILEYTSNDVNRAYQIIGIIHKAKHNVAKNNGLLNSKIIRYENNANIRTKLTTRLMHIFNYSKKTRNESSYIMNAMKTFFRDAFGLVKDEIVKPEAESKQPRIERVQPAWLNEPEEEIPLPSETDKAKIREMLKRFK